jgi:hypothetical protein
VQGVAGDIELAVQGRGIFSAEVERDGGEKESAGRWSWWTVLVVGVGSWGSDGLEGDVACDERGLASAGIDEAGVGDTHFALPGGGVCGVGMIGECAGDGASGGDVRRDAGAGDVEPFEEGCGGEAGGADLNCGGVGIAYVWNGSRDGESGGIGRSGGRPTAVDVLEAVEVAGGGAEALEVDIEGLSGDEVGASGTG